MDEKHTYNNQIYLEEFFLLDMNLFGDIKPLLSENGQFEVGKKAVLEFWNFQTVKVPKRRAKVKLKRTPVLSSVQG